MDLKYYLIGAEFLINKNKKSIRSQEKVNAFEQKICICHRPPF